MTNDKDNEPTDSESAIELSVAKFTPYEELVLSEIAHHIVSPGMFHQMLDISGKPVDRMITAAQTSRLMPVRKISEIVMNGVRKGLESSLTVASRWSDDRKMIGLARRELGVEIDRVEELRLQPLEECDRLADARLANYSWALGAEGAALGAATTVSLAIPLLIPTLIAADVSVSMTLLSHHASAVAASYGYSPKDSSNRVHILAAMAPPSESPDEGYLAAKLTAVHSIREAGSYLSKSGSVLMSSRALEKEAPHLVKLLRFAAKRLGIVLTQKELGLLVPLAGAAINGGLNLAFLRVGHVSAKDYFRLHYLEERYGEEKVRRRMGELIEALRMNEKMKKREGEII